MKTIFYSLPGEGLGHALRSYAVIERLKDTTVHVFTWGEAYKFYKEQNYPHLHEIVSLHFGRNKKGRISSTKTIINFGKFIKGYRQSYNYVVKQADIHKPGLFISDFEGVIPRVAKVLNKPCISIDNQHKFSRCRLDDLPLELRLQAWAMGKYTEYLVPNPAKVVVSTFYYQATNKIDENTILTNCFIRENFNNYPKTNDGHLLVYYKVSCGDKLLKSLAHRQEKIKVYNCPKEKQIFPFEYHDLKNEEFVRDLSSCRALFASAGNQLLGEGTYYQKPMFVIPEPNQPEQTINGYYINKMNLGVSCDVDELSSEKIDAFLRNFTHNDKHGVNGVDLAIEVIENSYI